MKRYLITIFTISILLMLPSYAYGDSCYITHDLIMAQTIDEKGTTWEGGLYTQNPFLSITIPSSTECESAKVSVIRCNGIVKVKHSFSKLNKAIENDAQNIEIIEMFPGETKQFDISIPGRYTLAYCSYDKQGTVIDSRNIAFDSLFDDGNWDSAGTAILSTGILDRHICHVFWSNGNGFLEDPGDSIWWECPITYPYYNGETWEAPLEYHNGLKMYRIVNPFTCNPNFKDYMPDESEHLSSFYDNVAFEQEGFLFDRQHPAWFLLNAEDEHNTWCEPTRTGITLMHNEIPHRYIAHPYNQMVGYVIYNVCPIQDIANSGVYKDLPMDDDSDAVIAVRFPDTNSIDKTFDQNHDSEYFSIDGKKVMNPLKGLYIKRQNGNVQKIAR